jgi:hypothetical protein
MNTNNIQSRRQRAGETALHIAIETRIIPTDGWSRIVGLLRGMSDFLERKPVPLWRIVCYGILAAVGVATIGYYNHDHRLYVFAIISGVFIGVFGFALSWTRANVRPIPGGEGRISRYPAWVRWLFIIGVLATAVGKLLDILHKN